MRCLQPHDLLTILSALLLVVFSGSGAALLGHQLLLPGSTNLGNMVLAVKLLFRHNLLRVLASETVDRQLVLDEVLGHLVHASLHALRIVVGAVNAVANALPSHERGAR